MDVGGPNGVGGVGPVPNRPPRRVPANEDATAPSASGEDKVQISPIAKYLSDIQDIPEVREDKVQDVRARIAEGTYETPQRLDVAVDRLLGEILGDEDDENP